MKIKEKISLLLLALVSSFHFLLSTAEVLFSPDDHPTSRLLELINGAHNKIHAAVYMLTDKDIAQALVNAKKRGVHVKIILDPTSVDTKYGKGKLLIENKIDTFVFTTPRHKKKQTFHLPIMHNKFALIDNKLWTGSFNWTISANKQNQENVIITDDQGMYQRFERHFAILEKRCIAYAQPQQADAREHEALPPSEKESPGFFKIALLGWWNAMQNVWHAIFV